MPALFRTTSGPSHLTDWWDKRGLIIKIVTDFLTNMLDRKFALQGVESHFQVAGNCVVTRWDGGG